MKRIYLLLITIAAALQLQAQAVKVLFDATKAEMAGNADWVIDADQSFLPVSESTEFWRRKPFFVASTTALRAASSKAIWSKPMGQST